MQRAPEGAGVPGKQPKGLGGGDAHKTAATAKLPGPGGSTPMKPGLKTPAAAPPASVDVDVSDFDKGPAAPVKPSRFAPPAPKPSAKFGALNAAGSAEVARMGGGGVDAKAQLKADKKAGGVGFLNALIRKFRPLAPARGQQGLQTSQRFHGALPLARAENDALAYAGHAEVARMKAPPKPDALKDAGNKDVKRMKANKIMGKIEKAEDMGDCAVCHKPESKCLCKGMSMNHNRTMLKLPTKKSAKKSR
jgi:hypothetical protein